MGSLCVVRRSSFGKNNYAEVFLLSFPRLRFERGKDEMRARNCICGRFSETGRRVDPVLAADRESLKREARGTMEGKIETACETEYEQSPFSDERASLSIASHLLSSLDVDHQSAKRRYSRH